MATSSSNPEGGFSPTPAAKSALATVGRQLLPFVIGGGSGIVATTCVHPIDMVKVRLQLLGEGSSAKAASPLAVGRQIVAEGRFLDLYSGISAAWLRQASYATLRLGFFDRFQAMLVERAKAKDSTIGFGERALAGLGAGGLAAAIANPSEVALIRMQADGITPKADRANYRSVVDALVRIGKTEGITALWSGSYPTIIRAMATNFGQLAFFSESKNQLSQRTSLSERNVTIASSSVAGFFAAFFSLPFDFLKTRLQRGGSTYAGVFDCAVKVAKQEGLLRFYRGFGTYFLRIAPHTVITLIVADNVNAVVKRKLDGEVLQKP
ncbi:mitochondrial 2-oxoglutarate/malate carrier protein [Zymoseptoria brevis]|uniref:Mitochondrial 2-oxoglutarate/malate carrier protein n=1 Tax=Zymoseptoria brevis TaxID=1047168 RepID=A0A0F4GCD7_9PEZI|nr:mitochondrial 2-oxoglutarate/malate carrier protein [Zymoseptoria brevis]